MNKNHFLKSKVDDFGSFFANFRSKFGQKYTILGQNDQKIEVFGPFLVKKLSKKLIFPGNAWAPWTKKPRENVSHNDF